MKAINLGKRTSDSAVVLTDAEKKMYSAERGVNFRFVSTLLATTSSHVLADEHMVDPSLQTKLFDIGQFTALVYSPIPLEILFPILDKLIQPRFPLEGFDLSGVELVKAFRGSVAALQVITVYRASQQQLLIAIAGTSTLTQIAYNFAFVKHSHPSGSGAGHVHGGFWSLYEGIVGPAMESLKQGLETHKSEGIKSIVITGHSMGGVLAHFLTLDILTGRLGDIPIPSGVTLTLAVFGAPRGGDKELAAFWREQVKAFKTRYGQEAFEEYSVKAYRDGAPTLPPKHLGWRHFTESPLYLKDGRMFHTPASQCENSAFIVSKSKPQEANGDIDMSPKSLNSDEAPCVPLFPKGGHNYYNGRDLGNIVRRFGWLERACIEKVGWEERYLRMSSTRST